VPPFAQLPEAFCGQTVLVAQTRVGSSRQLPVVSHLLSKSVHDLLPQGVDPVMHLPTSEQAMAAPHGVPLKLHLPGCGGQSPSVSQGALVAEQILAEGMQSPSMPHATVGSAEQVPRRQSSSE